MARRRRFQNAFTTGEVGPEFLQRAEEELQNESAQALRNVIIANAGGIRRRPGSVPKAKNTNGVKRRIEMFDLVGDEIRGLVMTDGQLDIYETDGTLEDTLVAPWGEADIDDIVHVNGDNRFYFFGDFFPQQLTYTNGVWTLADIDFESSIGSTISQPYWRFSATKGISLTPSALTGSITLTSSDDLFEAGHVGTRFRYIGNEILITAVTNATTATGTVITALYPTIDVTVASSAGFQVGEVVTGDTSGAEGVISSIPDGTSLIVTLSFGYTYFADTETLDGPSASTTVSGAPSAATAAASVIWDEQMISSVRGYPRAGVLHRNRLIIAGFPQAPNAVAASATGFENDFDLGQAEDADAFIEALGDDQNATIRHLISSEQLVLLTDRACYYVPESENSPLTPTRVSFNRIGPDGASTVRPLLTPEGVVFVDNAGRLLVIGATGSVRASWAVQELSLFSNHLLTGPKSLTYVDGLGNRSERYVIVLNEDATAVAVAYRRGAEQVGVSLWTPAEGFDWLSIAAWKTRMFCIQGDYFAEFDMDATMDLELPYTAAATLLAGESVYVARSGIVWQGPLAVNGSGLIPTVAVAAGQTIGKDFRTSIIPSPPVAKQFGYERRRISRLWTDMLESGPYRVDGELVNTHDEDDDLEAPPPLRSGASEPFFILGYDPNSMPEISQEVGEGAPFFLRSLTMEIAY
jgi:hypothetical protein